MNIVIIILLVAGVLFSLVDLWRAVSSSPSK